MELLLGVRRRPANVWANVMTTKMTRVEHVERGGVSRKERTLNIVHWLSAACTLACRADEKIDGEHYLLVPEVLWGGSRALHAVRWFPWCCL